ncbi:MAG: (deoxy)nucleoside triphosphate pyrophosphohydrolase [Bdellovibrionales bacterium]
MCCDDEKLPPIIPFTRRILVAAAALYDADGRVLISEHIKPRWRGYWEFPGGLIEENEVPELTVIRELKEELGITVCRGCLQPITFASYVYEELGHMLMALYAVRKWEGTPTSLEGKKLAWVKPNELKDWNLLPADIPLISYL